MANELESEAVTPKYQLEKRVRALENIFIKPISDKPQPHNANKAKQVCEDVNIATEELRCVLSAMFCQSSDNE